MLAFAGAVEVDQRLCLLVIRAATVVVSGIQSPHGYEGVTRFSAVLLAENRDAIGLFENLGDATCEQSGSELRVDVELPGPRLRELLGATAAGILRFAREDG